MRRAAVLTPWARALARTEERLLRPRVDRLQGRLWELAVASG